MEKSNINHCVRFKILFIYLFTFQFIRYIIYLIFRKEKNKIHLKKKKNLYLMIDAI